MDRGCFVLEVTSSSESGMKLNITSLLTEFINRTSVIR